MKSYQAIFFWIGGVLTDTLADITLAQLVPGAQGHEGLKIRQQLRSLAEDASLGIVGPRDYCERAISVCESEMEVSTLAHQIVETSELRPAIAELIGELPDRFEVWLINDFPIEWCQEMSKTWEIKDQIPEDRWVHTSGLGLRRMVPDIFYAIPHRAGRLREECVVIDADSARAVAALNHGLPSIIYVYPEHLRLDLALQKIWQTEADIMHPTSSRRVRA